MVNTSSQHSTPTDSPSDIPPLESGDRLIRPEFERRYNAMPNLKKAELIEGVVYVASPLLAFRAIRLKSHSSNEE